VIWNPEVLDVKLLYSSAQLIHVYVDILGMNTTFLATFVYGFNKYKERKSLWRDLRHICSPAPWILLGDFNVVRYPHEKLGGEKDWPTFMEDFNDCSYDTNLDDLRAVGLHLTWRNKAPGLSHLSRKLDRALINPSWISNYPNSEAEFLTPGVSDHSPVLIRTGMLIPQKSIPFRF